MSPDDSSVMQGVEQDAGLDGSVSRAMQESHTAVGRLQCPVLLPQRRPKDRTRGFIRAYAPALEACGINQSQWMDFLASMEKSSRANPMIQALNLASLATMALPSLTSFAISVAIQVATKVAAEGQARYKMNTFLDKTNKEVFQPRGLYCLIMTWNTESDELTHSVDMASQVAKAMVSKNKFKGSSGRTYGDDIFPEVAPLVFPGLTHMSTQAEDDVSNNKGKLAQKKAFADDYFDRRATAKYASEHPDSVLTTSAPTPQFHSRYADPNHPASSGDLVSLITGGRLSNSGGLAGVISKVHGRAGLRGSSRNAGLGGRLGGGFGGNCSGRGGRGPSIKNFLKQDVLYLLVVNMPSEEELDNAREILDRR